MATNGELPLIPNYFSLIWPKQHENRLEYVQLEAF